MHRWEEQGAWRLRVAHHEPATALQLNTSMRMGFTIRIIESSSKVDSWRNQAWREAERIYQDAQHLTTVISVAPISSIGPSTLMLHLVATSLGFNGVTENEKFDDFVARHGKTYTVEEYVTRKSIFEANQVTACRFSVPPPRTQY